MQAQNIVKTLGILLASNVVEQVDWYNLYDMLGDSPDRIYSKNDEYSQVHFGLFNADKFNFAVTSGAMAFRFFSKITNGFKQGKQLEDGEGMVRLSMELENNAELDMVWNNNKSANYKVEDGSKVYDLMGNIIENNGTIILTREPVYILK